MNTIFDTKHLYKSYFKLAFPVVLGLVVTLIYNLADTFFYRTNERYKSNRGCILMCSGFYSFNGF